LSTHILAYAMDPRATSKNILMGPLGIPTTYTTVVSATSKTDDIFHPEMEPLCRNLDLKPTHCSPISTKFMKPTSLPRHSHRLSGLNRRRSKNRSVLMVPCAWHKPEAESETQRHSSQELMRSLGKGLFGFAAATAALASVCCDSPALAESLTVAFPVSRAQEVIFFFFRFVTIFFNLKL
jgi:hypothetical protein